MISFKIAQITTEFIILFIGYLIAITPVGWFRSMIALRMGDETGRDLGLLTLNPFAHISIIGLICFLVPFYRFGWGKHVPVNLYLIHEKYRNIKFATALFSDTFGHWFVALISSVVLISLFGQHIFFASHEITSSSLNLSHVRILLSCIHLSILLSVVSFIVNTMVYYISVHNPELYHDELFNWYFLFTYLIIAMTIGNEIVYGIFRMTIFLSLWISSILRFTIL